MWNEISFMDKALFPVFSLTNNDFFFWQVNQISINLTTNERINKKRYVYLRGPSGIFLNPFDRGCYKNWLEYFHWVEPYDKKPNLMYNVWKDQLERGLAVSDNLLAPCLVYSRNARQTRKGRARNPIMSCQCERKQIEWKRLSRCKNWNVSLLKLSARMLAFKLLSFRITLALGL